MQSSDGQRCVCGDHDPVTGLPNRHGVAAALEHALRAHAPVGLLLLDLDGFKRVNRSLGHDVGDRVLAAVGAAVQRVLGPDDRVGRIGSDEFVVVLRLPADRLNRVAAEILAAVRQPIAVLQGEHVTASLGSAIAPDDGADFETLLRHADAAMDLAKQQGKNGWRAFSEALSDAHPNHVGLVAELRRAARHHELSLVFQPQFRLHDRRVVGLEALLRWHSSAFGTVSPAEFIPLAESMGLMGELTAWVLTETCRQLRRFNDLGLPVERVAMNVSAIDLRDRRLAGAVERELRRFGVPPRQLEIEITEGMLADDDAQTRQTLGALKRLGVRLAVDDFGTGYSSLCYLQRLPIDQIKLDRSFIKDVRDAGGDTRLVSGIVALAKSLGLELIAEGVETPEQLSFVIASGCSIVQGYLLGRPIASDGVAGLWATPGVLVSRGASP